MQNKGVEQSSPDTQRRGDEHAGPCLFDDLLLDGQAVREKDKRRKDRDVRDTERRCGNKREDKRNGAPNADEHRCQPGETELRRQSYEVHDRREGRRHSLDRTHSRQKLGEDGNRNGDPHQYPVDIKRFPGFLPDGDENGHVRLLEGCPHPLG